MKIVLDTHTLLWFIDGDTKLPDRAREMIEDTRNEVYVSAASLIEIAIKLKLGKLLLRKTLTGFLQDVEDALIATLPIYPQHLIKYQHLPVFQDHRDPFDRLIIASASAEGAALITVDPKFAYYQDWVELVW